MYYIIYLISNIHRIAIEIYYLFPAIGVLSHFFIPFGSFVEYVGTITLIMCYTAELNKF